MRAKKNDLFPCFLILDANILVQDFWLVGTQWKYLEKRNFLSHKLVIPEIALEEASAALERRAEDLLDRIKKDGCTERLKEQYQRLFNKKRIGKETSSALASRYQKYILKRLNPHGAEVAKTPDIELSTLVQRSIRRTKPFNQGDKGFRDTLIWLTVVNYVERYNRVSFISANVKDYATKEPLNKSIFKKRTSMKSMTYITQNRRIWT